MGDEFIIPHKSIFKFYKPDSVAPRNGAMIIYLGPLSLKGSMQPTHPVKRKVIHFSLIRQALTISTSVKKGNPRGLFGLAPGGVYPFHYSTSHNEACT